MLEDRAALAGHGQADHVVEIGDQLFQEPVVGLRRRQRFAAVLGADLGQVLRIELEGGVGIAIIDDATLADTDADGQHANVVGSKEFRGKVAGCIDHQADPHVLLLWPSPGLLLCERVHTLPVSDWEVSMRKGGSRKRFVNAWDGTFRPFTKIMTRHNQDIL